MTKLIMLISCVEYYGHIKDVPSNKVYISFDKKGILGMLLGSYDVFKDMDIDFYMGVIDGYALNEMDAEETNILHPEERSKLLPRVIRMMVDKTKMDEMELLRQFYNSKTGETFAKDETGYYAKSPDELFALWLEEREKNQ